MYFRFILAPFFWWSISFPDILDFYKASEGGSYFSLLAFAICELCKRLVVPWALSHVRYGIDQKHSRYSRSAHFRCDWILDNKIVWLASFVHIVLVTMLVYFQDF